MSFTINNKTTNTIGPYDGGVTIAASTSYAVASVSVPHFAKDVNLLSDSINNIVTISLGSVEFGGLNAFNLLVQLADTAPINKIGQISGGYINLVGGLDPSGNAATSNIDANGQLKSVLVGNDGLYTAYVDSVGRLATNANVTYPEAVYIKEAVLNGTSKDMNVNGSSTNVNFRYTPASGVYYLEQLSLVIEDQGDFLTTNFGALATLTNGIQINVKTKGQTFTIATIKENADIYGLFTEAPASQAIAQTLAASINSYWAAWRLQNRIVLDSSLGDYIEFKVRDNLTGLTNLNCYVSAWKTLG